MNPNDPVPVGTRPFNPEEALMGYPVVTRAGKPWFLVTHFRAFGSFKGSFTGRVEGENSTRSWQLNGRPFEQSEKQLSMWDLFIAADQETELQTLARRVRELEAELMEREAA